MNNLIVENISLTDVRDFINGVIIIIIIILLKFKFNRFLNLHSPHIASLIEAGCVTYNKIHNKHITLQIHYIIIKFRKKIYIYMQVANNNKLPFIGMELIKIGKQLKTCVHWKTTNKGLLLHYQSHGDARYKRSLLMTMLNRAHCLSSSPDLFAEECDNLKGIFLKLKYPDNLINSTITRFIESRNQQQVCDVQANAPVRIILPFKDQRSADVVRSQLSDLGKKVNSDLRPVFTSKKIADDIKVAEAKPPLINQQCVVYEFKCDLCDADYVGYTRRHLFQRIEEHKHSAIGKHLRDAHNQRNKDLQEQFTILKKCRGKFECLIYEMLFIQEMKPKLNTQSDSIKAKLFSTYLSLSTFHNVAFLIKCNEILTHILAYKELTRI